MYEKQPDGDVEIHEKTKVFRKNESIPAFSNLLFRTAGLRPRDLRVEPRSPWPPDHQPVSELGSLLVSFSVSGEVSIREARNGFITQVVR